LMTMATLRARASPCFQHSQTTSQAKNNFFMIRLA